MKTIQNVMDIGVSNMDLSTRCQNGLKGAGIKTLSDITKKSMDEISLIRNMGKKSLDEISTKLESIGLKFCMTDYDWLDWGIAHKDWILQHESCL